MSDAVELATVELLGAIAYGQLRSFEATARTVGLCPDARTADLVADVALREHAGYVLLRDRLGELTNLPTAVMDRQKPSFDAFFDRAPLQDWFGACVFFSLGLPMAGDFCRSVSSAVDQRTAGVLAAAFDKEDFQQGAMEQLAAQLDGDEARERARQLSADLLGRALTSYQGVVGDTDALKVLMEADTAAGETAEQRVKRLAIEVLSAHRRRVVELGLEDLDDVR